MADWAPTQTMMFAAAPALQKMKDAQLKISAAGRERMRSQDNVEVEASNFVQTF